MIKFKIFIVAINAVILISCENNQSHSEHNAEQQHEHKKIYTCPIHPEIIRDKPGRCPICGKNLVEKKDTGENIQNEDLPSLLKPTNEYVLSQVKMITLREMELPIEFTATGNIKYDTRLENTVSARVSGRIEKLYIKYKYQPIRKGEKLMDIYSKDLLTEEENYLLLKNDPENKTIINAAENKLMLMGLTKEQIEDLKTTKKTNPTITIYSPFNGHLHDISSSSSENKEMGNNAMTQEFLVKEGMYIEKGQTVFNIYSTDKVWAVLNIYPEGQNLIKEKQQVTLQIDGAKKDEIIAKIDFIEPVIHDNQKTISVRVYLDNAAGDIKIGAIVKGLVLSESRKGNYIPSTSILSLGTKDIVFVKRDKLLKSLPIKLGIRTDGWQEVVSGISKTDRIAENAQLLMDSESFIKTNK